VPDTGSNDSEWFRYGDHAPASHTAPTLALVAQSVCLAPPATAVLDLSRRTPATSTQRSWIFIWSCTSAPRRRTRVTVSGTSGKAGSGSVP
jgi:hypothetical protein